MAIALYQTVFTPRVGLAVAFILFAFIVNSLPSSAQNGPPPTPIAQPLRFEARNLDVAETTVALESLREILGGLNEIRVFMVHGPGSGHQAANITSIQRLR